MRQAVLSWTIDADGPGTRAAYASIRDGAARRCGCPACRNFGAARPAHYPDPFRRLLESLNIDPCKEAEVRRVSPLEGERHLYAGAYGICGSILAGRPFRGFPVAWEEVDVFERVGADAQVALRPWGSPPAPWPDSGCVRLDFLVVLPWVLDRFGAPAGATGRGPGFFTS